MELPRGVKKRRRADKRIDLVHKDDLGQEYVALTTEGDHVSESDVALLRAGDREVSSSKDFADHFVKQAEANKKAQADAMEKEYMDCMENEILPVAYKHSPRQCQTFGGGTKVLYGGFGHPRHRCMFGGCDYCY